MLGPLPETLELTLGNQIYVPKEALSPALRNRLIHLAAFQNPEFYKAQANRRRPQSLGRKSLGESVGQPRNPVAD